MLPEASLPPAVDQVLRTLQRAGYPTYMVGGSVRDLLRGVAPKDFDLATAARPEQVQACFRRVLPTGLQHGTVTVLLGGEQVEVTTFRTEGVYLDGRRPSEVSFRDDVRDDLARRDFTINAMAYDPVTRTLVDPFGGRADLDARMVRCVGVPEERFGEDGLRVMRAVRIATVLDFNLDGPTEAAISGALPVFNRIAIERVTEELRKLMLSPHVSRGLLLLRRTGLTATILPGLWDGQAIDDAVARVPAVLEARLAVWLGLGAKGLSPEGALAHLSPQEALARLRLSRKQEEATLRLVDALSLAGLASASDGALRRVIAKHPIDELPLVSAVSLAAAPLLGLSATDATRAADRLHALQAGSPPRTPRDLALDGAAIMRVLDVKPSPLVGEATRYLMDHVLDDPSLNTAEALTGLLRTFSARPR